MTSGAYAEFIFIFNDEARAQTASVEVEALGYTTKLLPADGEGRHFQLRIVRDGGLDSEEHDRIAYETLRPLLARHRGRYAGGVAKISIRDDDVGLG